MSEEEEERFLEEAYTMSLESPEADKFLNSGTAAPRCQPKHTQQTSRSAEGQEVVVRSKEGDGQGDNGSADPLNHKHRRGSSMSDNDTEEPRKKLHTNDSGGAGKGQEQLTAQQQKKLSYFQMARLGYQELVNAIIRPPRADYKVRFIMSCCMLDRRCFIRNFVEECRSIL